MSMPDIDIDYFDSSSVAIQVNGSDVIHLEFDTDTEEWIRVRVFDSTHPHAGVAFENHITWDGDARSRSEETDMPKFKVHVSEGNLITYLVEADSAEQAEREYPNGEEISSDIENAKVVGVELSEED
jgi:hypothetical protein